MSHQSSFEQVLRIIFLNVQRDSSLLWVCHITTSAWEIFQNPLPPVAPVTKVSGGNQNSEQTSHQANAWSLVAVVASSLWCTALLHPSAHTEEAGLRCAIITAWLLQSKLQCMRYFFQIFINMRVYSCLAQQTCVTPSVWPRRSWPRGMAGPGAAAVGRAAGGWQHGQLASWWKQAGHGLQAGEQETMALPWGYLKLILLIHGQVQPQWSISVESGGGGPGELGWCCLMRECVGREVTRRNEETTETQQC